nr:ribonuclease H-like domain-containing protein [Tanacetum cinerariifolium]
MAGLDDEIPPPPPPPQTPTQQAPHTVSTIKLHILKKGEYDIWAMKIEHYLGHTDYSIWEVIQKGNGLVQVSTDTNRQIKVLPPKTTEEILAREREKKARTTLLMAIPEDHLAKFHKMTDAKEMFEILLSQLEIHGTGVSTEDANQKFLSSLPASWSQVSLIVRTKPGVDTLSFYDLYNNLRVFESDVKGSTTSSSSIQNVEFVSFESTSSTNKASTAYGDLEQLDEFGLEEMGLKWQVAMISMRLKKFYKKIGRKLQFDAKEPVGFDKTKVECFNYHKTGHFAREYRSKGNQDIRKRDACNTGDKAKDNGRRPGK